MIEIDLVKLPNAESFTSTSRGRSNPN